MSDITQAHADAILGAARESARETGTAMNIAVVDAGGNLKAFTRMDGPGLGSIDISIKKARTAASTWPRDPSGTVQPGPLTSKSPMADSSPSRAVSRCTVATAPSLVRSESAAAPWRTTTP